jgi:hypothetical protein
MRERHTSLDLLISSVLSYMSVIKSSSAQSQDTHTQAVGLYVGIKKTDIFFHWYSFCQLIMRNSRHISIMPVSEIQLDF